MKKIIRIVVDRKGQMTMSAEGYIGEQCLRDVEKLLELGAIQKQELKPEYYDCEPVQNQERLHYEERA